MNNSDERDYAEEEANSRLMREEDNSDDLRKFAETAAKWHFVVACHPNQTISTCTALGGKIYDHSRNLLLAAIKAGYPSYDEMDIYDVWVDCNESIAYCADVVNQNIQHEKDNEDNGCEGHESLRGDKMGETVFCDDNYCKSPIS